MTAPRRILALGGHDFDRRAGNDAICELIVELADSPRPRICLLPTASGDPKDQIVRFRRAFSERDCRPHAVSLFRLGDRPIDLRDELLSQHVIYAGGGSMINLMAVWRAHGLDEILRECWEQGILICGQSAGAMCWFHGGITSSQGEPAVADGLGVLPGSLCVHYRSAPPRRRRFIDAIAAGELEPGIGLEDQTGALFEDTQLVETVKARDDASAWEVTADGGRARESELDSRLLEDSRPPINGVDADIAEYRQTIAIRAMRRRSLWPSLRRLD
ncbi:MAG: Type 1 glutamine amidotransferase-like domain-containing protein [Solirubrobacterales bacterium]